MATGRIGFTVFLKSKTSADMHEVHLAGAIGDAVEKPAASQGAARVKGIRTRLKLSIRGAVQGVGFRPFIHRLATNLGLTGWVNNSPQGVTIEVEGEREILEKFLLSLEAEKPPRSSILSLESSWLEPVGYSDFAIRASETGGVKTALVLPDIATCPDCLREIFEPANRRYRYPFTNCTNCGPRISIIERLPYDRQNTSMKSFAMCADCQAEYDDPANRRFHAQPNACPVCGPSLELWNPSGEVISKHHDALMAAADALRSGQIVAVKGIGGFHLITDARNDKAVQLLRQRKHREEKPLALMFPSLESIKDVCEVSPLEQRLLLSPEAPIVLLRRIANSKTEIANSIAPGNPYLGVMLPCSPLHHLLMAELNFPIVATSGNLSDEPICTDQREALERLRGIADLFLVHNRPIVRHVDDSIVRVMLNREMVLRRARGYAPLPILLPGIGADSPTVLAVGGHLKNTVALAVGDQVFISQHIGDLETEQAHHAFRRIISDFQNLYEAAPQLIAADCHPDYLSTKFARQLASNDSNHPGASRPLVSVQHHIAHVFSCMAENQVPAPVLALSWDGTGYGLDGTIWGGEFFLIHEKTVERVAHFAPFRLPGGEKAVKEPRRTALGLLHQIFGDAIFARTDLAPVSSFSPNELENLKTMLGAGLNSPTTTSAGRLFDAVASLINIRQRVSFEGQAAMELEFALDGIETDETYPLQISKGDGRFPLRLDWAPTIRAILQDVESGAQAGHVSAGFHNALAETIVEVAKRIGEERVVLSGGCFQNRYLTERAVRRLQTEGFRVYWHQRVPPNDGGIALGQVMAALRQKRMD
jgi:[NiFe] hydrogenase maturation protein HypF